MQAVVTDTEALETIAANVRRLMEEKRLTYAQLARDCSIPSEGKSKGWTAYPSTIEHIAKGENMPGAGLLMRLAEALGVTPNDLMDVHPRRRHRRAG
jgi:transcriptional regulator with XRE-family HTH domain